MSLQHQARQAASFVRGADIVIGIAVDHGTGRAARAARLASAGLAKYYPGVEALIAVCGADGEEIPPVDAKVVRLSTRPGAVTERQDATRLLIELAAELSAKALAILDPDSAVPESIDSLLRPVLLAGQDFAAPVYRDSSGSGLLSSLTLYPMMRCLYGRCVRNPAPGEFAMSRALLGELSEGGGWITEAARRAPSLWIASEALDRGHRVCDTLIPARGPAVRGASGQVAALLSLIAENEGRAGRVLEGPELFGVPAEAGSDRDDARSGALAARFLAARRDLEPVWRTFLRKETVDRLMCPGERGGVCLSDGLWAHVLFELADVFRERTWFGPPALETFPVLHGGRVAAYRAGIGTDIERSCQVFDAVRTRFEQNRAKGDPVPCLN